LQLAGLATLGVGIWMDVDPHYANTLQSVGVDFYIAGINSSVPDACNGTASGV